MSIAAIILCVLCANQRNNQAYAEQFRSCRRRLNCRSLHDCLASVQPVGCSSPASALTCRDMKVLVIGANGNTGTRVVRNLVSGPHDPIAMIRESAQRPKFDDMGVPTVVADLEYPIDHAVKGCDAVIFAAGSGGHTGKDKTVLVDYIGAIRAIVTAQVQGARRFVMLSALNAEVNSTSGIAHYHKAKAHADNHLRETDLDYTIICPGGLHDEPGTGRVSVSSETHGQGVTSRDNLAVALVTCLDPPNTHGKTFSLLDGDTPLEQALPGV